jgi:hypothetical protein
VIDQVPKPELIGRRFCSLRQHPRNRGRVAIVMRVYLTTRTGCGVGLTYRYEDSPSGTRHHVSQYWFLRNFSPVEAVAEASGEALAEAP